MDSLLNLIIKTLTKKSYYFQPNFIYNLHVVTQKSYIVITLRVVSRDCSLSCRNIPYTVRPGCFDSWWKFDPKFWFLNFDFPQLHCQNFLVCYVIPYITYMYCEWRFNIHLKGSSAIFRTYLLIYGPNCKDICDKRKPTITSYLNIILVLYTVHPCDREAESFKFIWITIHSVCIYLEMCLG